MSPVSSLGIPKAGMCCPARGRSWEQDSPRCCHLACSPLRPHQLQHPQAPLPDPGQDPALPTDVVPSALECPLGARVGSHPPLTLRTPARASGRCLPLQPGAGNGAKAAGAGHILRKLQTPGTSKTCTLHRQPPGPAGAAAAKDRDPSHRGHLGTKQPHPEPGPAPAQPEHPEKGPWPALFTPLRVFSCPGKSARPGQGGFAAERRGGGEVLLLVRCKQAPGAGQPRCPLITSGFVWNKQQPQVRAIISPRCFRGPGLRLQT